MEKVLRAASLRARQADRYPWNDMADGECVGFMVLHGIQKYKTEVSWEFLESGGAEEGRGSVLNASSSIANLHECDAGFCCWRTRVSPWRISCVYHVESKRKSLVMIE